MKGSYICLFLLMLCVPSIAGPQRVQPQNKRASYVCPMHAEVSAATPGKCPKCGMSMRPRSDESSGASSKPDPTSDGASINPRIPDTVVYDQDGRKLHFYSDLVKGKTVAINFIFTTCTTICPPLTATFRRVQQELGERAGREVSLISISVDPATDVPERLKSFASKFKAGPGWTFVTGSKPDMDPLLRALGAAVGDKTDHTPMVLIGNDAAGYWTRTYGLASPSALAGVISEAVARTAPAPEVKVPLPAASSTESPIQKRPNADAPGAQPGATSSSPPAKPAKTSAEAAANYFPNTVLLTQDNTPVHFFDDLLKGKTVVINFMFATCTGVCPAMTANLAKVQEYLGDRVGKDINMISITVDPVADTPGVLKKYAAVYKVKGGWYFLTGPKTDVDFVLSRIGGFVKEKNDHTTLLIVGNIQTGEWAKLFAMGRPAEIVDAVLRIAESK